MRSRFVVQAPVWGAVMTVVMSYRRHHRTEGQPVPPDTTAQQVFDLSQSLAARLRAVYSGWSYLCALEFADWRVAREAGRAVPGASAGIRAEDGGNEVASGSRLEVAHSKLVSTWKTQLTCPIPT
jgi:hypothetical protein